MVTFKTYMLPGPVSISGAAASQSTFAGGLIGAQGNGYLSGSYATGAVTNTASGTGTNVAGGLVGGKIPGYPSAGTASSSYWDTQTTGQTTSALGTGYTTSQLQGASLPAGLSPTSWTPVAGHYPYLAWQGTKISGTAYSGTSPLAGVSVSDLVNGSIVGSAVNTDSNGKYSFFLPMGSVPAGAGVLTYLTGGLSSGNTFSDGKGTSDFSGMDIYTGQLRILNSTFATSSALAAALTAAAGTHYGTGSGILFTPGTVFDMPNRIYGGSSSDLYLSTTGAFTVDNGISTGGNLTVAATGALTLGPSSGLSNGSGNIVLSTGYAVTNNVSSGTVLNPGDGNWLVYSQNPGLDHLGSLTPSFWQYNATLASTLLGSGNGVIYSYAPIMNVRAATNVSKTYDGTTAISLTSPNLSFTGLAIGDTASMTGSVSAVFNNKNVGGVKPVTITGTPSLTIKHGTAPVYGYRTTVQSGGPDNIGNISPAQATFTFTVSSRQYDQTTTAGISSMGALTGILPGDTVWYSLPNASINFSNPNAGTHTVTVQNVTVGGQDAANYQVSGALEYGTILPKTLTASLTANNKTYDGTLNATGTVGSLVGVLSSGNVSLGSSGTMQFADKNAGNGKTVTDTGATLTGPLASNYTLTVTPGTADILPKSVTAALEANSKVYDGTTAATADMIVNGVLVSDQVSGSANYLFADKNAGTGKTVSASGATLSGADAGNYLLGSVSNGFANITPKPILASVVGTNKIYDGTTADNATLNLAGLASGDTVNTSATYAFSSKNVGNAKAVAASAAMLTGADAGNYTLSEVQNGTADITPATLTQTIYANSKFYNATAGTTGFLGPLSGIKTADQVSVNTASASYNFSDKNVGNGKTVTASGLALQGSDSANYVLAVAPITSNIYLAQVGVTGTANNKVYDGTTAATGTLGLTGVFGSDQVSIGSSTLAFTNKNAGTNKRVNWTITLAGSDASNYQIDPESPALHANITPVTLAATAAATNKIYDGLTSATGSVNITGVLGSDQVSVNNALLSFGSKNVGSAKPVTATATLTGGDAGNYTLPGSILGTADITPATLTQTVYASSKFYDATTGTTGSLGPLSGIKTADQVSVNTASASYNFSDKNVGNGKTVTASGLALQGSDASNYLLTVAPITSNIYLAQVGVEGLANNKVYDGTTAATGTLGLTGVFGSDQVSIGSSTLAFTNKNAGTNKRVNWTITLAGSDASNYQIDPESPALHANITPAPLSQMFTAANKVYDGSTAATATLAGLTGVISGDQVAISGTGAYNFDNKNAGTGKMVTASGLALSGSDANNYSLAVSQNGTADITPATLTQTFTAANKVYDGTTAALATLASLTGVVSGDQVAISGTGAYNFDNKNAGTSKTVTASGLTLSGPDANNYTLALAQNATADITPAILTATYNPNSKVYDGTTAAKAALGALTGAISGNQVSLYGAAQYNFADKNAGTAKSVTAGGLTLNGQDAGNYTLTLLQAGRADITAAQLLYVANNGGARPFGVDNPGFTGTVTGLVNGETLASAATGTAVFTSPATPASNIGTYAVNGSGLTLKNGNYVLAQAPGNANAFSVQPITISIGSVTRDAGAPNPTFAVNYSGPSSEYLKQALSSLALVTNAPASDAPGTYQITAVIPAALLNDILVQPGTLTINSGTAQTETAKPALLETAAPPLPAPLPSVSGGGSGDQLAPGNAIGTFQVVITPSQSWSGTSTNLPGVPANDDALSHSSFTEISPDGRTTKNNSTYAAGARP